MADRDRVWQENDETKVRACVDALVRRADSYRAHRGWSETYFGRVAAGDHTIMDRLRGKGRVTAAKMQLVEVFLNENPLPNDGAESSNAAEAE